jgi:hypothetical protein
MFVVIARRGSSLRRSERSQSQQPQFEFHALGTFGSYGASARGNTNIQSLCDCRALMDVLECQ